MDPGKRFEACFNKSIAEQGGALEVGHLRLPDPGFGFRGIANPCDYVVMQKPVTAFVELKSRKGNRMNFSSTLTDNQYHQLTDLAKTPGVIGLVLYRFNTTGNIYAISIEQIEEIEEKDNEGNPRISYQVDGKKSLNEEEFLEYGYLVPHTMKRTNYDIDVGALAKVMEVVEYARPKKGENTTQG